MSSTGTMPNPAASFEPHRRRLRGLAYRMLGSLSEAEDAVHERRRIPGRGFALLGLAVSGTARKHV